MSGLFGLGLIELVILSAMAAIFSGIVAALILLANRGRRDRDED